MRKLGFLIVAPLLLAGCLGGKNAPDATLVVDAPALVIPPNFELRPPRTDAAGTVISPAQEARKEQQQAQDIILGGQADDAGASKMKASGQTSDAWLIKKAGGSAQPNASIRELMQQETALQNAKNKNAESKGWFSRNFGKKGDLEPVEDVDVNESDIQY